MFKVYDIHPRFQSRKIEELVNPDVIIYVNDFTEESAKQFHKEMAKAHDTGQTVIPVVIDSYGGQVHSLLSMMDAISASRLPVATVAVGKAMSCGSFLLSCGAQGMRFAGKSSTIMIHDLSGGTVGKTEEAKVDIHEIERLKELLFSSLAKNCNKKKKFFTDMLAKKANTDWYMTPTEAKRIGLINHIGIPQLTTKFSVESSLVLV